MIGMVLFFITLGSAFWPSSNCGWTREDVIKCAQKHIDTNKDGKISLSEVRVARQKYGGWVMKVLNWMSHSAVESITKNLLRDCDVDKDGYLESDDFRKSAKTCLPTEFDLCIVKMACDKADEMTSGTPSFWSRMY